MGFKWAVASKRVVGTERVEDDCFACIWKKIADERRYERLSRHPLMLHGRSSYPGGQECRCGNGDALGLALRVALIQSTRRIPSLKRKMLFWSHR
jgi:hypothetical protein